MSVTTSQIALFRAIANTERMNVHKSTAELLQPDLKIREDSTELEDLFVPEPVVADPLEAEFAEAPPLQRPEPEKTPSEHESSEHDSRIESVSTNHHAQRTTEELDAEKKLLIREFQSLRAQHPEIVTPDDRVCMESSFDEVHLALVQARNSIEVASGSDMLKDGLRIGSTGLEYLAPKLSRKMVSLDGWSNEVTADLNSGRYDAVLAALYRKYWRSGGGGLTSSPIVQLMFMLLASAGIFAFKKKFDMPASSAAPSIPAPRDSTPETFAEPPPANHNRPRMRPPSVDPKSSGLDMSSLAANIGPAMSMMQNMGPMMGPMMGMMGK